MRLLSAMWFSVRGLFIRDRVGGEIDEELAFHLERETRLHEQEGMTPSEARREANRTFGGVQRYREECRDVRRGSWLEDLRTDVRYALRLARHHPGFSINVVLISALGIAACVTIFSLVSGIILAPLSFPGQDKVFSIVLRTTEDNYGIPVTVYRQIADAAIFDGVSASEPGGVTTIADGEAVRRVTGLVTASFFREFRIRPVVGRAFGEAEVASRAPVVLLGYDEWQRHYGADQAVSGKSVTLDGQPYTIIGVMPKGFLGPFEGRRSIPALWMPLVVGENRRVNLTARVADSVSTASAEAWLQATIHARVESVRSGDSLTTTAALVHLTEQVFGDVKKPLSVLLGAVLLVLMLVAANVATMFLARSGAREGELGLRTALGATQGRQLRQLLTESVTLTAIGGALGMATSIALTSTIRKLGVNVLPRIENVSIDWRVIVFAVVGVILTGCVGGTAHALAARRMPGAGTSTRVTRRSASAALVVVQIALSVVLLVGAGLLVKGFMRVAPTSPGFTLKNRATVSVRLQDRAAVAAGSMAGRQLLSEIVGRMRRVAGVEDVAVTSYVPLTGSVAITELDLAGAPAGSARLTAFANVISPNYFAVMEIPIKRGRSFASIDDEGGARVAVINETAAAKWWPGGDPIGRVINLKGPLGKGSVTIIGVVRGSRMFGRQTRLVPELYLPVAQSPVGFVSFVASTAVDPKSVLLPLRRAIHEAVPQQPVSGSSDLETTATESSSIARFYAVAMGLFAGAAVILSALGVYGLLSFAVAQRKREIGIRMALGATSLRIGRTVIGRALAIGIVGVLVGGALARGLSRYMESLLLEVKATDPAVFSTAIVVVFVFAMLAAFAPTYQAVRVDPIKSLRSEL